MLHNTTQTLAIFVGLFREQSSETVQTTSVEPPPGITWMRVSQVKQFELSAAYDRIIRSADREFRSSFLKS